MYSIIRTKKLKSFGSVIRSAKHTFREQLTPNADQKIGPSNKVVGAKSSTELKQQLESRLPDTIKAKSVLCIEYMITASPEAFKRHGGELDDMGNGYFNDAIKWLRSRHGQNNVICSVVHLDETTPHLVAYVAPMTKDNRLSCRDFLGGPAKMKQMHTDFHNSCGKQRGLERGIEGSKAKHQDIKSFYTALASEGSAPKLKARDYAAAAFGIKTARWRKAEALAESQAQAARIGPTMRKSLASRAKASSRNANTLNEKSEGLRRRLEVLEHRRILLEQVEYELGQRSQTLAEREKTFNAAEQQASSVEAERNALQRRLEAYQMRDSRVIAPRYQNPRKYDDELSLV